MSETTRDIVIVANRLPITFVEGSETWQRSPGGLVSALLPIAVRVRVSWVGWPGTADADRVPDDFEGIKLHPIHLSEIEIADYYLGFSNGFLWPHAHGRPDLAELHDSWWYQYQKVNELFAERVVATAEEGARVFINDYHLQLVPGLLKGLRPDLRVGFFMHIPSLEPDLAAKMPHAPELFSQLIRADLIGFQTERDSQNFYKTLKVFDFVHPDRELSAFGVFPVQVQTNQFDSLQESSLASHEFNVPDGAKVFASVDRLDYSKGIIERLHAFSSLLKVSQVAHGPVLLQVLVPSRQGVSAYDRLRAEIIGLSDCINQKFGSAGYTPVQNYFSDLSKADLYNLYRRCDVFIVSSVKDGMNLVAKEFVLARSDLEGVLVLSEHAGAADELQDALLVDPLDEPRFVSQLLAALEMSEGEARRRMSQMRNAVINRDAENWAVSFLEALENFS